MAGLILFAMPDRIGRKTSMVLNFGLHVAAQYLIIFVPTYGARLIGFLIYGLTQLKNTVSYIYLLELIPEKYGTVANVSMTSFDSATMAFVCLYFILISKDWFPLMFVMTLMSTFALLVIIFVLTESPIWLLNVGRTKDAIDALNKIGRFNGVKSKIPKDAIFNEAI